MRYVWDRGESEVKTVSSYVTPEKVNGWTHGDIVLISAPTGSGKSYFVKHTLRDYLTKNSLKCLYLLPRTRIKEQFQQELPNDAAIRFETYQAVATKENYIRGKNQEKYDVIVADESHFFFSDADFNHATDLVFEWILAQRNAIRVFMSATNDVLMEGFEKWGVPYTGYILEGDKNPINSLNFFWSENQFDKLAERIISNGEKGVFFIQSAEKAHNLYKKYMDEPLIDALLENERFDCTLLITTLAFDCGVTLRDRSITTVVTDVTDPVSIVQCCGRKRFIDENDRLDVYVLGRTNQQIKHRLTMVNTPLNKALGVKNQIFHSNETRSPVAWTWERIMSATCRRSSKSMLSQLSRWEDKSSIFCGETVSAFSAAISLISLCRLASSSSILPLA